MHNWRNNVMVSSIKGFKKNVQYKSFEMESHLRWLVSSQSFIRDFQICVTSISRYCNNFFFLFFGNIASCSFETLFWHKFRRDFKNLELYNLLI